MDNIGTLPLYAINDLRDQVDDLLYESDGEITPDIEERLDALAGAFEQKTENIALYIRELEVMREAIKFESMRLAYKAAAKEKAVASLKRYLLIQMERAGVTKVAGPLASVTVAKNSQPTVTCALEPMNLWTTDAARLYVKREEKIEYAMDRQAILAAWRSGVELPPTIRVEQGSHIRIR